MLARRTFLAGALLAPGLALGAEPTAQQIVAAVDALRLPPNNDAAWRTTFRIVDGEGARRTVDKLEVLVRGQNSLVKMLEGQSRGMKFLGTPQGYWLYAPNTRRAMRLTAQQMLRGNTSVGDISRLRFADDYSAAFATPTAETVDGRSCWVIALRAKSPAATYATVRLRVAKTDLTPVSADLFAISGRRLKSVLYGRAGSIGGRRAMTTTTYVDGVDASKRTTVELLTIEPSKAPAGIFRPEALPTEF